MSELHFFHPKSVGVCYFWRSSNIGTLSFLRQQTPKKSTRGEIVDTEGTESGKEKKVRGKRKEKDKN